LAPKLTSCCLCAANLFLCVLQKTWTKIVDTLWNERSGKLREYRRPADVSTFRNRFFKACESRCNRIQQPGQHSDSTDPATGEEVPQADQVAEQIWMEHTNAMEAAKEKTEKVKKRKAAFKEASKALCPSSRSLVEIAIDKRVKRVNQIVGSGNRTLSERQQNEVAVLLESELNGVSLAHASTSNEVGNVDDDGVVVIDEEEETKENRKRSITKGYGTARPVLSPRVDAQKLLTDRMESRKHIHARHASNMACHARTEIYAQLKTIFDLKSCGILSAEEAAAQTAQVKEKLKEL
jgi:hypothetical protein